MSRYIPIIIGELENVNITAQVQYRNLSIAPLSLNGIEYNVSIYQQHNATDYAIILYILMTVFSFLMIYIMLLYLRTRVSGYTQNLGLYRGRDTGLGILPYDYSYEGLAKILREVFVSIRDRFCGRYCTPRETAMVCTFSSIFRDFADIYEEVVYGLKTRMDAINIVQEVKKYISENQ